MSQCAWCKIETKEPHYPNIRNFYLSYEEGTTSDLFGPNLDGYEIENLCSNCAWKLKEELEKLGISIIKVNV